MQLRQTARALRRAPWYSAALISVSAIAFTAAGTVLALTDGILFRALPYPDSDRLVSVAARFRDDPKPAAIHGVSVVDIAAWANATPEVKFAGYMANPGGPMGRRPNDPHYGVAVVQENFFDVIGVQPLIGGFVAEDFRREQLLQPTIISYDVWQGRYQGVTPVVGVTEVFDPSTGHGHRIVGVMPKGFVFPAFHTDVRLIRPFVVATEADASPTRRALTFVIARLPDALDASALRGRIESAMAVLAESLPPRGARPAGYSDRIWRQMGPFDQAEVESVDRFLRKPHERVARQLGAAAVGLLLVVGLTASALTAARVIDRERELRLRTGLGAARLRIVELVFVESFVCAVAGMVLSTPAAAFMTQSVLGLLPPNLVLLKDTAIDFTWLALFVLLMPAYVVASAFAPALCALALASRTVGMASYRSRLPRRMTMLQVSACLLVVVVGFLLVKSLRSVYAEDVTTEPEKVLVMHIEVQGPGSRGRDGSLREIQLGELVDHLRSVPNVLAVGFNAGRLLDDDRPRTWSVVRENKNDRFDADVRGVTGGFYDVMKTRPVAGRLPSPVEKGADEVVVSESLARKAWPDGSALGSTVMDERNVPFRVVGIVEDVRWIAWDREEPSLYGPYRALVGRSASASIVLRVQGNTAEVTARVLREIPERDPLLRVLKSGTVDDLLRESVRERRLYAWTLGALAVAALVVLGIGVLGTAAMATIRRKREAGVRLAVGAARVTVVRQLVSYQVAPLLVGLTGGVVVTGFVLRMVNLSLYQVTIWDPAVWFAAISAVALLTMLATVIPALFIATRIPATVLRQDQ